METIKGKFYECVLRYDKTMEDGLLKKVSETYCVESSSFADAEIRILEKMAPYFIGEYEIKKIAPTAYNEIFIGDSGNKFYKAKLQFITVDEKTLKEKKESVYYLVCSKDFPKALDTVQRIMGESMTDYTTAQICESKVLDFYGK